MFELSQEIVSFFQGKTEFTTVMSNDIYAVIAPENQQFPFAVFTINQQESQSKDIDEFDVTLFLWFDENKYDQAIQFTDVVTALVKGNPYWDWRNSTLFFVEDNISYCGVVNFKK